MKTFKFSLVLRTRENTDVFITLDDNIYGIHSKRVNILYLLVLGQGLYSSSQKEYPDCETYIFLISRRDTSNEYPQHVFLEN